MSRETSVDWTARMSIIAQNREDRIAQNGENRIAQKTEDRIAQKREEKTSHRVVTNRRAYTYDDVEEGYKEMEPEKEPKKAERNWVRTITDNIPLIEIVRNYDLRKNLYYDVIAGISVACLHLPQGLAYGLLANLSPLSGVYTNLLSVIIYLILGTVPQMSMGTNAMLSLITANMVDREADRYIADLLRKHGNATKVTLDEAEMYHITGREALKLGIAKTSTFTCGLMLIALGLCRGGYLTNYMPSSFVGGFTCGAAFHIVISQLKHIFRAEVGSRSGVGKLLMMSMDVYLQASMDGIADFLVCMSSFVFLIGMDYVVNPMIKKYTRCSVDIPSNLVLVIVSTLASYLSGLHSRWGVNIIGEFEMGLPGPEMMELKYERVSNIFYDTLTQAVIVFTVTISMAMLMAKIHQFEFSANRELVAYGACNLISSFFSVQSSSVSPPRTMLLSRVGVRTTLNAIPTIIVLVLCVTVLGKALEPLPIPTLAAMIILSVMSVIAQIRFTKDIWRVSRIDFIIWMVTFIATVAGDLHFGVIFGIATAVFGYIVSNQLIEVQLINKSEHDDLYIVGENREHTKPIKNVEIFYFPSQLFFANADLFKREMFRKILDPVHLKERMREVQMGDEEQQQEQQQQSLGLSTNQTAEADVECIIIDCTAMTYIDLDGLNMLKTCIKSYDDVGVVVLLVRVPQRSMATMERGQLFEILPRTNVFHQIEDALAIKRRTSRISSRSSRDLTQKNSNSVADSHISIPGLRPISTYSAFERSMMQIH